MNRYKDLGIEAGKAICYSGYRSGQSPETGIHPTYEEVKEDLLILHKQWDYLRLYDTNLHSETVLEVIRKEKLNFKVMLGAYILAEENNSACPWGGVYPEKTLEYNRKKNTENIKKLTRLAGEYKDVVFATSAGNEATVDWTDHYVPVDSVIEYVRMIKAGSSQPVTFCENYLPWLNKLEPLAGELDFISIHTYPAWEYKRIQEAMPFTRKNFEDVAGKYPGKPVMITEAGWTTRSNGRGIDPSNVSEEYQERYYKELVQWSEDEGVISFVFEAFDEPWKGSGDKYEPEKHWGLFYENRKPKKVLQNLLD